MRGAIGTVCANFMFSAKSRIYLSPHPPPPSHPTIYMACQITKPMGETRLWDGFCEKHSYERHAYEMHAY